MHEVAADTACDRVNDAGLDEEEAFIGKPQRALLPAASKGARSAACGRNPMACPSWNELGAREQIAEPAERSGHTNPRRATERGDRRSTGGAVPLFILRWMARDLLVRGRSGSYRPQAGTE